MAWLAIFITVVAATGNNVGKAMQKEATRKLPRFALDRSILVQYARSRQWLAGLAADLAGALLMIAAFALAPVSLVQPVSGVGLVSLALFSHFYLQESLTASEWLAVALSAAGTIGLGATSEDAAGGLAVSTGRAVTMIALCVIGLGAVSVVWVARRRHRKRRGAAAAARTTAYVFGLQAGTCFGLSAACCRTGFLLAKRQPLCVPLGLAASVGLTSGGFALQTCGLKDGNSLVVCTAAAATSMVSGVVVGLLALGERLPTSAGARLARLASWLLIMAGVSGLAAGSGGAQQILGMLVTKLPTGVWSYLPANVAVALRTSARAYTESRLLPVINIGEGSGPNSPLLTRGQRPAATFEAPKLRGFVSSSPRRSPAGMSTQPHVPAGVSPLSRHPDAFASALAATQPPGLTPVGGSHANVSML